MAKRQQRGAIPGEELKGEKFAMEERKLIEGAEKVISEVKAMSRNLE